jgi:hypothetical protein
MKLKQLKEIILKQLNEFDADMNAEKFKAKYSNLKGKELKDAFESAYFWSTSSEGKESLRDLINTYDPLKEFASELEDYMKQADAAKGTVNTNPNRQFGASNQPTVRRSGGGLFEEKLRMQMLAGIITESEYKTKLNEDKYNDSQAEARLAELANKVFQEVSNYKDLTPELIEEEPGYYRIKFTKLGKLFRKEKTGELHLFVDQNPDTLIMKVIFNGELEQKDTLNWGEGMFANDDAIYDRVAREADKVAMHLIEK